MRSVCPADRSMMQFFRIIWARLRSLIAPPDGDFDDELDLHISLLTERAVAQGVPAKDAHLAAQRQFGSTARLKEDRREAQTFRIIETVWQDLRFGVRSLRRNPGFAIAAIGTLALGLGVNAAIFGAVKAVLLKPMPYSDPDRLVMVSEDVSNAWENSEVDYTTAAAWRRRSGSFEGLSAYRHLNTIFLDNEKGEMAVGLAVTHDFFTTLGVRMQLGRNFVPGEDRPGQRRAVILTDGIWARRFNADPGIVGRILHAQAGPLTVVGVLPRDFEPLIKGTT